MLENSLDVGVVETLVGLTAEEVECELILATLRRTGGNRTHAATVLDISIRTLRNRLRSYESVGIDVDRACGADESLLRGGGPRSLLEPPRSNPQHTTERGRR